MFNNCILFFNKVKEEMPNFISLVFKIWYWAFTTKTFTVLCPNLHISIISEF